MSDPLWREYVRPVVASTMDWARKAAAGAAPGVDIFRVRAGVQTAGRGRRGSTWRDAPGQSLLTTLAIRRGGVFDPRDPNPAIIALRTGNGVADLVAALGVGEVTVKWPNDILVHDRKLCGILVEADPRWFYVGIGLNVGPVTGGGGVSSGGEGPSDGEGPRHGDGPSHGDGPPHGAPRTDPAGPVMPPVSLNEILPRPVSLAHPLSLLDSHLRAALDDPDWNVRINRRLAWKGTQVSLVAEGTPPVEGRLLDVDETGGIRILQNDGVAITAVAGTLRRRGEEETLRRLR
jgi:biotin-(acetyl-CoA carboxylase) ligase